MARRATSLGPKPSLFVFGLFFVLFLSFILFVGFFGGGCKVKGPPHLALNPPSFWGFVLFSLISFLSLSCILRKTCFPLRRGIFVKLDVT